MYSRIRELREARNLQQYELAEIVGCTSTNYTRYETGQRDFPTAVLIRLADFYETSVDYLLGETDCPEPYPKA